MIVPPYVQFAKEKWNPLNILCFIVMWRILFRKCFALGFVKEIKVTLQSFTITDILFGVLNIGDDFFGLNHLILAAKLFIYECKFNSTHPSIQDQAKIKTLYHVKKTISNSQNKLKAHSKKKWTKFLPPVSSQKGCPAYAYHFTYKFNDNLWKFACNSNITIVVLLFVGFFK